MSRTITNIILGFLLVFALLFTIPTYFQGHLYYSQFFGQLFPPLHLLWFLVLPFLIVFSILFYKRYTKQTPIISLSIRPLHIIGSVLLGLLLLFNIYSLHPSSNVFRTYTEDFTQVQTRLTQTARIPAHLQGNNEALTRYLNSQRQSTWRNAEEVLPKESLWIPHLAIVANVNFLGHILFITTLLLLITASCYNLGTALFRGTRLHRHVLFEEETAGPKALFAIALGISLWIVLLLLLGSLGLLSTMIIWIALGCSLVLYRFTWEFMKLLWTKYVVLVAPFSITPVLCVTLWLFVTMTAYQLFRPIPIGWDDMSVYMNIPHLISQSGSLVVGHSAYGWSLFMSLGFLTTGSTVLTMFLSWIGGLFALLGLYFYTKTLYSGRAGLLMATIFASLPMVLFQMSQDMKIDMGLLFLGMSSMYLFLLWWRRTEQPDTTSFFKRFGPLFCVGLLLGSAFSVKYTAFLLLCVYVLLLGYRFFGWMSVLISLGFLGIITAWTRFTDILGFPISNFWYQTIGILGITALIFGLIGSILRHRRTVLPHILVFVLFFGSIALPIAPWILKHYTETGSIHVRTLLSGGHTQPALTSETIASKEETTPEPTTTSPQAPRSSGVLVELGRYFGYDTGWFPYMTLPYTQTMNTHVSGQYVDISFLFLVLVPLALIMLPKGRHHLWWNILFVLSFLILLITSHGASTNGDWYLGSIFEQLTTVLQQPIGTTSFAVTGGIILSILGALLLGFWQGSSWTREQKVLLLASGFYWVLWALLGSGVIWYGIFGFLPLLGLVTYLDHVLRHGQTTLSYAYVLRFALCLLVGFWLLTSLTNKLGSIETPAFAQYKAGVTREDTIETMLPSYLHAAEAINSEADAYVYRVGTFLSYFIDRNISRVLVDNQLDYFHNYYVNVDQEQPDVFLERLRRSNIEFIVLDLNVSTIDQTEQQSLVADHKRFLEFINEVQTHLEVVSSKLQETTIEQLTKQPPRIGSTLVFYTRQGTLYRVYTGPSDLTLPAGTQRIAVGQGSGALIVWKLN